MTAQLNNAFYKKYSSAVESKAKANLAAKGITSANSNYNTLFTQEAARIEESLSSYSTLKKDVAAVGSKLAAEGRMYEYASTIAHEFGHVLGMNHSPNKADLMYFESGSSNVYSYAKVKAGLSKYNPITTTDKNRAKLALKVYAATR